MLKKSFPIENVLTVFTGVCMKSGIGMAQDVFDHLYPGIMTLGCAAMQPRAARELLRQHPWLGDVPQPAEWNSGVVGPFAEAAKIYAGGAAVEIEGPILDGPPTGLGLELEEIARIRK